MAFYACFTLKFLLFSTFFPPYNNKTCSHHLYAYIKWARERARGKFAATASFSSRFFLLSEKWAVKDPEKNSTSFPYIKNSTFSLIFRNSTTEFQLIHSTNGAGFTIHIFSIVNFTLNSLNFKFFQISFEFSDYVRAHPSRDCGKVGKSECV